LVESVRTVSSTNKFCQELSRTLPIPEKGAASEIQVKNVIAKTEGRTKWCFFEFKRISILY
jgi:hypothetical protein